MTRFIITVAAIVLALNLVQVVAQIKTNNRKPFDNEEMEFSTQRKFRLKVKAVPTQNNIEVTKVVFEIKQPDNVIVALDAWGNKGGVYTKKKKFNMVGDWQWRVNITHSNGEKVLPWLNIIVIDTSPVASPVTTPVASPVTTPVASPVTTPVASPVTTPVASPVTTPVASPPVSIPPTPTVGGEPPINDVIDDIRDLLRGRDNNLGPKFVRLGFHMCVGGSCDGCVSFLSNKLVAICLVLSICLNALLIPFLFIFIRSI